MLRFGHGKIYETVAAASPSITSNRGLMTIPKTITISYLEALESDAEETQKRISLARQYYSGEQEIEMSERVEEFLNTHSEDGNPFRLNICSTIVRSLVDELSVINITGTGSEQERKEVEFVKAWWDKFNLASVQKDLYELCVRDGESFLLLEWSEDEQAVIPTVSERFVGTEVGGNGYGTWMIYENDDPNKKPIAAVKEWLEAEVKNEGADDEEVEFIRKRNIYTNQQVEKYEIRDADWELIDTIKFEDAKGETKQLAIQVIHFKNASMMPEIWDAIPIQDSVNKTIVDALASADLTAFRMFFVFGAFPTVDGKVPNATGSNAWKFGPGQISGNEGKEGSLTVVDGASVQPLMDMLKDLVVLAAQVTSTPPNKFIITSAVSSDKTIREQYRPLRKKAESRKMAFGEAWKQVFKTLIMLTNHYTTQRMDIKDIPSVSWEVHVDYDELNEKKKLEVPKAFLWSEIYPADKVEAMLKDPSYRLELEGKILEGILAAEAAGFTMEFYLGQLGMPEADVKKYTEARAAVPTPEDLANESEGQGGIF